MSSIKNKYFATALVILFCATWFLYYNSSDSTNNSAYANTNKTVHSAHADYPVLNSVTNLTYQADLIVTGTFTGNRVPKFYTDDNNEVIVRASVSDFEISKIFKGTTDQKIISVVEPAYENQGEIYTIEGYKLMNDSNEYILFLGNSDESSYRIVGMYQGQYALDNEFSRNSFSGAEDETEFLDSEVDINHYKELKSQVLEAFQ